MGVQGGKFLVAEKSTGSLGLGEIEPRNELQKDLFRNIRRKISLNCKLPSRRNYQLGTKTNKCYSSQVRKQNNNHRTIDHYQN